MDVCYSLCRVKTMSVTACLEQLGSGPNPSELTILIDFVCIIDLLLM